MHDTWTRHTRVSLHRSIQRTCVQAPRAGASGLASRNTGRTVLVASKVTQVCWDRIGQLACSVAALTDTNFGGACGPISLGRGVTVDTLRTVALLVTRGERLEVAHVRAEFFGSRNIAADLLVQGVATGVDVALENLAALGADKVLAGRTVAMRRLYTSPALSGELGNVGNGDFIIITLAATCSRD